MLTVAPGDTDDMLQLTVPVAPTGGLVHEPRLVDELTNVIDDGRGSEAGTVKGRFGPKLWAASLALNGPAISTRSNSFVRTTHNAADLEHPPRPPGGRQT